MLTHEGDLKVFSWFILLGFKAVFASTRGEKRNQNVPEDRYGSYEVRHGGNYERPSADFGGGYGGSMRPPPLLGNGSGTSVPLFLFS